MKQTVFLLMLSLSPASWVDGVGAPRAADLEGAKAAVTRAAVAAVEPSLVTIETIGGAQPVRRMGPAGVMEESFRVAEGPTTGVILTPDGFILTSSFNFARDPSVITVILADGRRFVARLVGRDLIRRIALLKIDAEDLSAPSWLSRGEIAVGRYAIAIGHGLGGGAPFVSRGIVSALNRRNGNAIQTDAKTSPVNYGGPLVDLEGRIMGLIVPMAGAGGALAGAEWYDSGIGFAIYRDRIDAVLSRLSEGQTIEPGRIGVILEPEEPSDIPLLDQLFPQSGGIRIGRVAGVSPAQGAGLEAGDKIVALDGQPVSEVPELQRRLSDRAADETITLTLKRRFRKFDVEIKLAREADIEGLLPPERPRDARPGPTSRPTPD